MEALTRRKVKNRNEYKGTYMHQENERTGMNMEALTRGKGKDRYEYIETLRCFRKRKEQV